MKYTAGTYALTKEDAKKLQNRIHELSGMFPKKSIIPVLITDCQAKKNEYYNQFIYNNITLKDFFA